MIRAILFDMDGVLMDSEPASFAQHGRMANSLGIELSEEDKAHCLGIPSRYIWQFLIEKYGLCASLDHILDTEKEVMCAKFASGEILAMPGAFAALKRLKKAGYAIGIATSNHEANVLAALQNNNSQQYVDAYTHNASVTAHKPAPDVFLRCAELVGVPPAYCLAVEDSKNGILSARAAGMRVAGFRYSPLEGVLPDVEISDFTELTPEFVASL